MYNYYEVMRQTAKKNKIFREALCGKNAKKNIETLKKYYSPQNKTLYKECFKCYDSGNVEANMFSYNKDMVSVSYSGSTSSSPNGYTGNSASFEFTAKHGAQGVTLF